MTSCKNSSVVRASAPTIESLERRQLLSTINWTNKGSAGSDTDGFNANYAANATVARAIVQRAVDDWARAIVNFNYSGGGNTFNVDIRAAPIGGRGLTQNITHNAGKPNSADIILDDNGGGGGWFFDNSIGSATVPDDGEYQTILGLFAADNPNAGNDLYRTAVHELAHAMGISQTSGLLINNFLTDVADDPNVSSTARVLAFNVGGGAVEGTFTNDGGLHSYEGPSVLGLPTHPNDLINAGRTVPTGLNRRQLISDFILTTLQQAYGYTVLAQNQRNTFAVNFNNATGLVTINGDLEPSGNDSDNIAITPSGANSRYFINGRFEDVPNASLIAVQINAGLAADTINLDVLPRNATVAGGGGDDVLILAGSSSNLDNIVGTVSFNGDVGSDRVLFEDEGSANAFAYTINRTGSSTATFTRPSSGQVTMFNTEIHSINGGGGGNTFNVNATHASATWTLNGFNGNDVFNIGAVAGDAELVDGPITINGMVGTDTFNYNDTTAAGTPAYTLSNTQLSRAGNGTVTFATIESINVNAGAGDNAITYNNTAFEPVPVTLNGGGGNDTIQFDATQAINGATVLPNILDVVGGAGSDTFILNDSLAVVGLNLAQVEDDNLFAGSAGTVEYFTLESIVWNYLNPQSKIFGILSTAAATPVTINGSSGNDSFNVGNFTFSGSLDPILGNLTLNGNGGADFLRFNDQTTVVGHTYTLNGNSFSRTGTAATSFNSVETVEINTGLGADTINIVEQTAGVNVTIDGGAALDAVNINSDGVGTAVVRFGVSQDLASLNIGAGGIAQLATGGNLVIETDSLNIAPTGMLDLANNSLIVDYTAASPAAAIRAALTSGYNGGAWNGNGINSSSAAATAGRGVGSAEASNLFTTFPATFAGRQIDNSAILVRHTRYGDTDLSGTTDIGDFARLAASFNGAGTGWTSGNFNYDNATNIADFALLAASFNQSAAAPLPRAGSSPGATFGRMAIGDVEDELGWTWD